MTEYVVTMTNVGTLGVTVRTFGPYPDADAAEQARRRVHFDHGRGAFARVRTFVSRVEREESR